MATGSSSTAPREARNGQIVVARIGDDVTVKRFKVRGHKAELIPANPDFETLHFDLHRDSARDRGRRGRRHPQPRTPRR